MRPFLRVVLGLPLLLLRVSALGLPFLLWGCSVHTVYGFDENMREVPRGLRGGCKTSDSFTTWGVVNSVSVPGYHVLDLSAHHQPVSSPGVSSTFAIWSDPRGVGLALRFNGDETIRVEW